MDDPASPAGPPLPAGSPDLHELAAMGRLVAGVAHELASPLQAIISMAEVLARGELDSDPKAAAQPILRAALRCRGIVEDLLSLAPSERGARRPLKVTDAILDACELDALSGVGEVALHLETEETAPLVLGDARRLSQVFLNLVTNARQAVREHGRAGLVRIKQETIQGSRSRLPGPPQGPVVRVAVEDRGAGVPANLRQRIFEPFFTTKAAGMGTGLGLSLSRTFLQAMGGVLYLDPRWSPGTRMVVELPITEDRQPAPLPARQETPEPPPAACRILLVDDDQDVLATYETMLLMDGHRLKSCTRAIQALEAVAEDTFDLILVDIHLPDLPGPEFLRRLTRAHPSLARKVIFATGDILSEATQDFLDGLSTPHLIKPFRMEDLYRAMACIQDAAK